MNATLAKDGLSFVMLASLSSAGLIADRTAQSFAGESAGPTLADRIAAAVKWVRELPRRHAVIEQLSVLSDHELSDIGLNRAELSRVFDAQFAAERRVLLHGCE